MSCQKVYSGYDIFNEIKFALFIKVINQLMADKTFHVKRNKYTGGKISKGRVLLRKNVDGAEKSKLFVTGK